MTPLQKAHERLEKIRKTGMDGEGLPLENSPEIYGNQRVKAYTKGYGKAISEIQAILPEIVNMVRQELISAVEECPDCDAAAKKMYGEHLRFMEALKEESNN